MKKAKYFVLIMLTLTLFLLMPGTAHAESGEDYWNDYYAKQGITQINKTLFFSNTESMFRTMAFDLSKNIKVKSSNPSICKISVRKESFGPVVVMKMGKPGKVTLNLSYTYKGKKYSNKATIKCVNYVNPFKSLKIGGKECKSAFNPSAVHINSNYYYGYKRTTGKGKISVKMIKGLKLLEKRSNYQMKEGISSPAFKNGQTLNLSNLEFVHMTYKDSEGYLASAVLDNRKTTK